MSSPSRTKSARPSSARDRAAALCRGERRVRPGAPDSPRCRGPVMRALSHYWRVSAAGQRGRAGLAREGDQHRSHLWPGAGCAGDQHAFTSPHSSLSGWEDMETAMPIAERGARRDPGRSCEDAGWATQWRRPARHCCFVLPVASDDCLAEFELAFQPTQDFRPGPGLYIGAHPQAAGKRVTWRYAGRFASACAIPLRRFATASRPMPSSSAATTTRRSACRANPCGSRERLRRRSPRADRRRRHGRPREEACSTRRAARCAQPNIRWRGRCAYPCKREIDRAQLPGWISAGWPDDRQTMNPEEQSPSCRPSSREGWPRRVVQRNLKGGAAHVTAPSALLTSVEPKRRSVDRGVPIGILRLGSRRTDRDLRRRLAENRSRAKACSPRAFDRKLIREGRSRRGR